MAFSSSSLSFQRLALLLILFALLVPGCNSEEPPKKVRVTGKFSPHPSTSAPGTPPAIQTIQFGFDHRLSPKDDVRTYLPFLQYLTKQTGYPFSLRFTEGYEDTTDNLGRGLVQFAAMGPVNCILAKRKYGAGCLVMGLNKDFKPEYRAVIFIKSGSPIQTLAELRNKNFAFGDRYSTQGHIIPRKMLEDAGIVMDDLRGYVFTGSHASTARAVLNGSYDAGAIQDTLAQQLVGEGKITILATSKPYPSSLICYENSIETDVLVATKTALLALDPIGIHGNLLIGWERTEMPNGFVEYKDNALTEIEDLVDRYLPNTTGVEPGQPPLR